MKLVAPVASTLGLEVGRTSSPAQVLLFFKPPMKPKANKREVERREKAVCPASF